MRKANSIMIVCRPVELSREDTAMSKNDQQPRKPATKFMQLRKKMQKAKVQMKKPTGKKK